MRPAYISALRAAYPRLLGSAPVGIGDGWYSITRDMLDKLERECRTMPEAERPVIEYIEQKYATLRVCLSSSTTELDRIGFEAEYESESTCKKCGKPGLRPDEVWWETLCHGCARARAEATLWRVERYQWLAMLAAYRTTATQLDGRACRELYQSATLLDRDILSEGERDLMGMLNTSKTDDALDRSLENLLRDPERFRAGLDSALNPPPEEFEQFDAEMSRSFETLLREPDKLSAALDDILTRPLDKYLEEIREIRAKRELDRYMEQLAEVIARRPTSTATKKA
jgi:hypothetical protein